MEADLFSPPPFPDDIWADAGLPDTGIVKARAGALLRRLETHHGAPRDMELVRRFCADSLPDGRVLIYGAGTHTLKLLDLLRDRPGIRVLAILDRLAEGMREFCGHPVAHPESVHGFDFDYVIVAHTVHEMVMLAALRALGVPRRRIVPVYSHPAYRAAARGAVETLVEKSGSGWEALVVTCDKTAIVPDSVLAGLLPERTLLAFVGRREGAFESDLFPIVDLQESLDALRRLIARNQPKIVYIRSIIYKNFLGAAIKLWFPHLTVVQELYDYCAVWPDHDLRLLFGLDDATIRMLRMAELLGGQVVDLTISKRGGAAWDRVMARCPAPYRLFFPQVTDQPDGGAPASAPASAQVDLLYAGFFPSPAFLRQYRNGYNFLPAMREVCRLGGLTADIFNSSDAGPEGRAIFADYVRDLSGPPVHYHARLPYEELLGRMAGYRFGWLCDHQYAFHADRDVGICNRWTGYVSGGLPVLLDGGWRFMGDFVRDYEAGVILDRLDPAAAVAAIRSADSERLRRGVGRLRTHLLDHNARVVGDLAAVVERGVRG